MSDPESTEKAPPQVISIGPPIAYMAQVEPVKWTTPFQVDEAEYFKCMTPKGALDRYPYDHHLAMTQLVRELAVEKVQAICELMIFKNDGPEQRANYMFVPAWVWKTATLKPTDDFWETGYLDVVIPNQNGYTFPGHWLKMFGIGFYEGTLPGGFMADDAAPSETRDSSRKPIGEAERKRFCELYLQLWGDSATETKALAAAKAAYPDNVVSRDPFNATFREIRGPVKRGKKPLSG
ncbi:MAG: hypothetical protein ACO1NN_01130 [Sphingopyxis sp.]